MKKVTSAKREAPPLMPDVGVLALVPDESLELWQPRHYVLTRLARFFQVLWVAPAPDWREMFYKLNGLKQGDKRTLNLPGLNIHDPLFPFPRFYRPSWLAEYMFDARIKRAHRALLRLGCRKVILYIWRPEFAAAISSIPFDVSCFHMDDEYSFSELELPPSEAEVSLIKKVDQVFIHSPRLMERKGAINPNTTFIPNGVDFEAYAKPVQEPRDLSFIPRPRIGYVGVIKRQLNWPLIWELVKRHQAWSFVFVGPRSSHAEILTLVEELSRRPNVYFIGPKTVAELPGYPQHCDACIMPYHVNGYTNNIYPLKLHEYLASGRPVVSSPIRSLQDFEGVISLVEGPNDWSLALTRVVQPMAADREAMIRRREIARQYDWNKLVRKLAQILCERLGKKNIWNALQEYS